MCAVRWLLSWLTAGTPGLLLVLAGVMADDYLDNAWAQVGVWAVVIPSVMALSRIDLPDTP
jgi:hypothetical protein